jgi:hypothetical protein
MWDMERTYLKVSCMYLQFYYQMEVHVQEPPQANYTPLNHGFILVKREQTVQ